MLSKMTLLPKISVIIPCFNHGKFLPEAVESVRALVRQDTELIVVDDGSTDEGTMREMDRLAGEGVHTIRQENKGLAAARNVGIAASRGEYILPLDADNRIRPGYLEHGVRILDEAPEVGVVYGDAEYFGTKSGRWHVGEFELSNLLFWNFIDACAVYRRQVWEQNGGYDGTMPVQGLEDWDFWLSTVRQGWKFAYVRDVLFDYRVEQDSMIANARRFGPQIEEFIAKKHGPLYRKAWMDLVAENLSVRATGRRFGRLLGGRLKQRIGGIREEKRRSN
jgi:glycosyltransferase involved in cell wall biosynthesis